MTLFARRTLQRILSENASFLTRKQVSGISKRLNNPTDENYLSTEWEQAILNAASNFGLVQHEPKLGSSRPDLVFRSNTGGLEFVADVTTLSDQTFHKLNPVEAFAEEFRRRVTESKWLAGGFDVRVDALTKTIRRGLAEGIRLKLPQPVKWDQEIFTPRFFAFVGEVQHQPEQRHQFDAVSAITGVHIRYEPKRRGFQGGSHLSFTLATDVERNLVYNALRSKRGQIKRAKYEGMMGVFLCDGGCQMVSSHRTHSSFGIDEIIRHFFSQFDSISFVVVFGVRESNSRPYIQTTLHLDPKQRGTDFSELKQVVDGIHRSLPTPEWSASNARDRVKAGDLSGRYLGTLTSGGAVKMSARELLEILAGVKTVVEFEKDYRLDPGTNPFRKMLAEGRLITKVTVEHVDEKDDDAVTIEFGKPDAAIARFRIPPA
jgi:hypothetical protein